MTEKRDPPSRVRDALTIHPAKLREPLGISLWALLTACIVFAPIFQGNVVYFRDVCRYFVPARVVTLAALRQGDWPLWDPFHYTGTPLLGQYQLGVAYPVNLLFLALPTGTAATAWVIFHFVAALLAMHLFLRKVGFAALSAAVAATGYAWSGLVLVDASNGPQIAIFVFAPLLLWAVRTFQHARLGLAVAFLWALFSTGGAAERAVLVSILLLGYAWLHQGRRGFGWVFGGLTAGSLLAAPLWVPALYFVAGSSVRAAGLSWDESVLASISPEELGGAILPFSFVTESGDPVAPYRFVGGLPMYPSLYLGSSLFFFAATALSRLVGTDSSNGAMRRRELLFWFAAAILGVLLALGRHTPLYAFLWDVFPPVRIFRYPVKYFFLTGLAAAILSAEGVERWFVANKAPSARAMFTGVILLAVVLAPALAYAYTGSDPIVRNHLQAAIPEALKVAGIVVGLAFLVCLARHRLAAIRIVLPAVIFFDLVAASGRYAATTSPEIYDPPPAASVIGSDRFVSDFEAWKHPPRPPALGRSEAPLEAVRRFGIVPNMGALWGLKQTDGYDGIIPASVDIVWDSIARAPDAGAALLGRMAVRWKVMPIGWPALPEPWRVHSLDGASGVRLYENPLARPRARVEGCSGAAAIMVDRSTRVEIDVRAESASLLILADGYSPGWTASVNGRAESIEPMDRMIRTVPVPAGRSLVVFEYFPPGLGLGLALALGGFLLIAAGIAALLLRRNVA